MSSLRKPWKVSSNESYWNLKESDVVELKTFVSSQKKKKLSDATKYFIMNYLNSVLMSTCPSLEKCILSFSTLRHKKHRVFGLQRLQKAIYGKMTRNIFSISELLSIWFFKCWSRLNVRRISSLKNAKDEYLQSKVVFWSGPLFWKSRSSFRGPTPFGFCNRKRVSIEIFHIFRY